MLLFDHSEQSLEAAPWKFLGCTRRQRTNSRGGNRQEVAREKNNICPVKMLFNQKCQRAWPSMR